MINIQASVSKGWLHHQAGFIFDKQYYMDPLYRRETDQRIHQFVKNQFPDYPVYNMESNLVQADYVSPNHILVGGLQPNMILGMLLGAEFLFFPDKDSDIDRAPLAGIDPDDLPKVDSLLNHPFLKELEQQISTIKEEHPELRIIPPFFWDNSGRATIHGIFTTSYKLIGENVMMMMVMEPDKLHKYHQWITDAYILLLKHFSQIGDFPITSVHIGECSGTMISPHMYSEFSVPYSSQIGRKLGAVRMHTCGKSDHLLEVTKHIDNLKVIDTGSNTSVAKMRQVFGPDFELNLAPPVEILLKEIPKQRVIEWLDQVLSENNGGPLHIAYHLEAEYNFENCLALCDELVKRGLTRPGRVF